MCACTWGHFVSGNANWMECNNLVYLYIANQVGYKTEPCSDTVLCTGQYITMDFCLNVTVFREFFQELFP